MLVRERPRGTDSAAAMQASVSLVSLLTSPALLPLSSACLGVHPSVDAGCASAQQPVCCVFCRFCVVPLLGNPDHAAAQHVLHGSSPGEGCVRDVLPRGGAVPQLLLAFPHCLLSLREGLTDFFKVSRHWGGCVVSGCSDFSRHFLSNSHSLGFCS